MLLKKQGLSGIVTTIIIIGIALVAVGVVWYILNTVIEEQKETVERASGELFKTCDEAGYHEMNASVTICDGAIKYIGGQKCCTVEPTA